MLSMLSQDDKSMKILTVRVSVVALLAFVALSGCESVYKKDSSQKCAQYKPVCLLGTRSVCEINREGCEVCSCVKSPPGTPDSLERY